MTNDHNEAFQGIARCPHCEYSLEGLDPEVHGICPECGKALPTAVLGEPDEHLLKQHLPAVLPPCMRCGYALTGLNFDDDPPCPECGYPVQLSVHLGVPPKGSTRQRSNAPRTTAGLGESVLWISDAIYCFVTPLVLLWVVGSFDAWARGEERFAQEAATWHVFVVVIGAVLLAARWLRGERARCRYVFVAACVLGIPYLGLLFP